MDYFDEATWLEAAKHPDWYLRIQAEYQALMQRAQERADEAEDIKEAVRSFFEERLERGELALGGPDSELDAERQPISQAVLHHSHRVPGYYTLPRLNAVHLLNIYVPHFASPRWAEDQHLKGRPITSNHYHDGKMVFWGYHWWVETDGTTTRLLPDEAVGWQAGNWDVNCRSIGICINDDLTHKAPTEAALEAVRQILQQYENLEILGHFEVNPKTECPGDRFLAGWKTQLVNAD